MTKKIAVVLTGPITHLDHLGVLAAYLDVPLLVREEPVYELAQTFYPKTNVIFKDNTELTFDYLSLHYGIILQSARASTAMLSNVMNHFSNKKVRLVYCPHGNSDKGHTLTKELYPYQDISLVYGQHMLDLLQKTNVHEKIGTTITTGNYRYHFYLDNRSFYDQLVYNHIFSKLDPNKKTILFAPTFSSREHESSFFPFCSDLIEQNKNSNLIIKPHPFIEEHYPAQTWHLLMKYEDYPNKLFLLDFPPIYPLLSKIDIYLGDFSSIGYDCLAFDMPMFFFNTARSKDPQGIFLHQCGIQVPEEKRNDIYGFMEENMEKNRDLSHIRKKIYDYTFAPTVAPNEIKQALESLVIESNRR